MARDLQGLRFVVPVQVSRASQGSAWKDPKETAVEVGWP